MAVVLAVAATSSALLATDLLALVKSELRPSSYLLRDANSAARIDEACRSLEAEGVTPAWPRDLMVLNGDWRLVYSSTLALPLPPLEPLLGALETSPLAPRRVEQRIDVTGRRVVNVVSLAPWPSGAPAAVLSALPGPLGGLAAELQGAMVTLELDHAFSVEGEGGSSGGRRMAAAGSVVEVRLEEVRRTLATADGGADDEDEDEYVDMLNPQVRAARRRQQASASDDGRLLGLVPKASQYGLGPLSGFAAGSFDTPYADDLLRISRGVGGLPGAPRELRIFERVGSPPAAAKVYATWQEEEDALAQAAAKAAAEGTTLPAWDDRWQEGGFEEAEAMDFDGDDNGMPDS